jgi:DEAD/DEAH box helicase domain-containing protein
MKKIVFDIETKNLFSDVGSNDPSALDISVVCIYDYGRDVYESYLEKDFGKLWPVLENADLLIGYNSDHFDIPLLNKYYPGDLTKIKSLDILGEIKSSYGRRMKLDQIAEGTFGIHKSGNGLDAVVWWKAGEIEKIIKYCIDDVKITKDVYEYAIKNNKLIFKEGGELINIPLNTSKWEDKQDHVMTHTLPF